MAPRWADAALPEAERGLRRIRGDRDAPALVAVLDALDPQNTVTSVRNAR
jgi:hypothetical protein